MKFGQLTEHRKHYFVSLTQGTFDGSSNATTTI